jgi:hypothetical protein
MSRYGHAALKAVQLVQTGQANNPPDAWEQATISVFGKGTYSQRKSCPQGAFLGLCENGLVKGIKIGQYTKSVENADYAAAAAGLLKANQSLINIGNIGLWKMVMAKLKKSPSKTHNQQMDVVRTLFANGLIK